VAKIDPTVMHNHTKLTISDDLFGFSRIFSVYLPSVNKSATATCVFTAISAKTNDPPIAGVKSVTAR